MIENQIEETEAILAKVLQDCYEDGRNGATWYPFNAAEIIEEYKKETGECTDFMQRFIRRFVNAMNAEYERGRKEAGI